MFAPLPLFFLMWNSIQPYRMSACLFGLPVAHLVHALERHLELMQVLLQVVDGNKLLPADSHLGQLSRLGIDLEQRV